MRTHAISIVLIVSAAVLAACGANAAPTEEAVLSDVYTAAASTLAVQEAPTTPTATPTLPVTVTSFTLPTTIPMTVTSQNQNLVSYNSAASTANGCNNAAYVSDITIPDETALAPGESFTKTWEFQNTGTCDWTENYLLTFISGTEMDGETTAIDQNVATGTTGDLSVALVAPDSEGTYTSTWQLTDEAGNAFGQSVYVLIVVTEDAATLTPTSTSTSEETPATEPTSTPTATTASEDSPTLEPASTSTPTSSLTSPDLITDTPAPVSTGSS
jgi:hypothetical protein